MDRFTPNRRKMMVGGAGSIALFNLTVAEGRRLLATRRGSVARLFDKSGTEVHASA